MATVETNLLTAEEFWEWASRPENEGKILELDQGRVVEMPPPGECHGAICFLIIYHLGKYVFQHGGYICSNDTGLLVQRGPDTLRGPDVMLFKESRRLEDVSPKFTENVPALVVEVLSPSDRQGKVNHRIGQYLRRRIPLVWLVDPEVRSVTVYRPGQDLYTLEETEELTGEDVLPHLRLPVATLFTLPGATNGS